MKTYTTNIGKFIQDKIEGYGLTINYDIRKNSPYDESDDEKCVKIEDFFLNKEEVISSSIVETDYVVTIKVMIAKDYKKDPIFDWYDLSSKRKYKGIATYIVYLILLYCIYHKKNISINGIKAGADKYWNRFGIHVIDSENQFSNYGDISRLRTYFGLFFSYLRFKLTMRSLSKKNSAKS